MFSFVVALLGFLAFGPQVVLSAFKFNFTAPVQQCEPVSITFSGNDDSDVIPSTLTLLPFNSKPFSIPIPNAAANSTGVTVTFLPLQEGTQFVASLDNAYGDNSARISDVFRVFPSPTGNRACLPADTGSTSLFTLPQTVSQCETFNVDYASPAAPRIRVFIPKEGSFELNKTADVDANTASYMLAVSRRETILLMAWDGSPERGMTTNLLTVQGDSSSSESCFPPRSGSSKSGNGGKNRGSSKISQGVIIGLSTAGGIIVLMSVVLALFLIRQRRRRKGGQNIEFDSSLLEKRSSNGRSDFASAGPTLYNGTVYAKSPPYTGVSEKPIARAPIGYVENPPYTASHFSPTLSDFDQPIMPPPAAMPRSELGRSTSRGMRSPNGRASSINPYDIEGMLNYASDRSSAQRQVPSPQAVSPRNPLTRAHQRSPSDVPVDPTSAVMSSYSNPFGDAHQQEDRSSRFSYGSSNDFEIITRPSFAAAASATPSSPGNGLKPPSSRFSDATIASPNGIGAFPKPTYVGPRSALPRDSTDSWGNVAR